jgi:hypothetical protein
VTQGQQRFLPNEPPDADTAGLLAGLLEGRLPPSFSRTVTTLAPGDSRALGSPRWHHTLVVVARGSIEVTTPSGHYVSFCEGAGLTLDGLPSCSLRNAGTTEAVLLYVTRRTRTRQTDESAARSASHPPRPFDEDAGDDRIP